MESVHQQHHLITVEMFSSLLDGRSRRRLSIGLNLTRTSKRLAMTTQRSPTKAMTLTPRLHMDGYATSVTSSRVPQKNFIMTSRIGVNFLFARLAS